MELASYQLSPLERLFARGQRDPWRGKKVPKRFVACGFGFAAAFGFGDSLTLESIRLNPQRFSNLHIPSLLKE